MNKLVPANQVLVDVFEPSVDIHERPDSMAMVIDLPGVLPENMLVSVERSLLRVQARPVLPKPAKCTVVFEQFRIGDFERSFILPDEFDGSKLAAKLSHGVLTITIPRKA